MRGGSTRLRRGGEEGRGPPSTADEMGRAAIIIADLYNIEDYHFLVQTLESVYMYVDRSIILLYDRYTLLARNEYAEKIILTINPNKGKRKKKFRNNLVINFHKPLAKYDRLRYLVTTYTFKPREIFLLLDSPDYVMDAPPLDQCPFHGVIGVYCYDEYIESINGYSGTTLRYEDLLLLLHITAVNDSIVHEINIDEAFEQRIFATYSSKTRQMTTKSLPFVRFDVSRAAVENIEKRNNDKITIPSIGEMQRRLYLLQDIARDLASDARRLRSTLSV